MRACLCFFFLFYCALHVMRAFNVEMSFDVYSYKDDSAWCDDQCYRSLKDNGLYFCNQYENKWFKNIHKTQ